MSEMNVVCIRGYIYAATSPMGSGAFLYIAFDIPNALVDAWGIRAFDEAFDEYTIKTAGRTYALSSVQEEDYVRFRAMIPGTEVDTGVGFDTLHIPTSILHLSIGPVSGITFAPKEKPARRSFRMGYKGLYRLIKAKLREVLQKRL